MVHRYNGGLTREQFLFYEIKITASLLCQGLERKEAVNRIQKENLFQFPTERMIVSIANTCLRRIDALHSDSLTRVLAEGPVEAAKQVNLYAMMKYNRIVWEFMTEVVGEKYRTREFEFAKKDVNVFFMKLQEQDEGAASWSEGTIQKIKQVLVKSLVECGFLDTSRAKQLNPIAIAPELEDEIRAGGDWAALPAFNCFR